MTRIYKICNDSPPTPLSFPLQTLDKYNNLSIFEKILGDIFKKSTTTMSFSPQSLYIESERRWWTMAQVRLAETKLRLVFEAGMDDKGKPLTKTKTFNNISALATADQLYQTAQAIMVLCNDTISRVERADSSDLLG
jgi:hypothetical protein